jgi:hypothetical protein
MQIQPTHRLSRVSRRSTRRKLTSGVAVAAMTVGMGIVSTLTANATAVLCADGSGSPPAWRTVKHLDSSSAVDKQSNFEVDASANLKKDGGAGCVDWATLSGFSETLDTASGSGDESFGQGTAENDVTPTVVSGSIPPNKSDLKAFGVYEEAGPLGGHYVALNWARINNPSGTTNMDFELNQNYCNPASPDSTVCASNNVTPKRTAGDLLITYDLAKGGTVPTISVRTWGSGAWGAAQSLTSSQALGAVNTSTIDSADKGPLPTGQDPYTFGEAVVDLDSILSTCGTFGSVYLKSRSSTSFSSEIKDFVPPKKVQVSNCATIGTQATASVSVGSSIQDVATLTGLSSNATGTVTFTLWTGCDTATHTPTGTSTAAGTSGLTATTTAGTYTATSDAKTPSVGTYYWVASYSGDGSNTAAAGHCDDANESSVVSPATPGISTVAQTGVSVGSNISDTATLSGATSTATGTVSFTLYGGCNTTSHLPIGSAVYTDPTSHALGTPDATSGDYTITSSSYAPTNAGTYYWVASYTSGDSNNVSIAGHCDDTTETSVVNPRNPSIVTNATATAVYGQSVSDTATLSGATSTAGGTVSFVLYGDCNKTTHTPIGAAVYTDPVNHALGTPDATTGDYTISSGSYTPNGVGTYYWVASYTGDSTNNNPISGKCDDTHESSAITPAASSLTTTQSFFPNDSATITGGGTGSVTFKLYSGTACTGTGVTPLYTETVSYPTAAAAVSTTNGGRTSGNVSVSTGGTYSWQVTFTATDGNHKSVTGTCSRENSVLTITNGSAESST